MPGARFGLAQTGAYPGGSWAAEIYQIRRVHAHPSSRVLVPDAIVDRQRTPQERQREEGKQICIEIIQWIKAIKDVSGMHITAYRQDDLVSEIVLEAGLLPRPIMPE